MKLKNKLLPLVGVATACAAVAPIATSCKLSTDSLYTDLTTLYKPTIKMYSEEIGNNNALTQAQANKAYFGDAETGWTDEAALAERFQQDFFWSKSYGTYFYNESGSSPKAEKKEDSFSIELQNVKFNYIKFGHETVYTSATESHDVVTMSFQADYSCDENYKWTNNYVQWNEDVTYSGTITVTNLPVVIQGVENYNIGGYTWYVLPYWEEIKAECVNLITINQIPFTFNNYCKCVDKMSSDVQSSTEEYSVDKSFYTAYISKEQEREDRLTKYDEFRKYWISSCSLNFASYYLYGNGVKQ